MFLIITYFKSKYDKYFQFPLSFTILMKTVYAKYTQLRKQN